MPGLGRLSNVGSIIVGENGGCWFVIVYVCQLSPFPLFSLYTNHTISSKIHFSVHLRRFWRLMVLFSGDFCWFWSLRFFCRHSRWFPTPRRNSMTQVWIIYPRLLIDLVFIGFGVNLNYQICPAASEQIWRIEVYGNWNVTQIGAHWAIWEQKFDTKSFTCMFRHFHTRTHFYEPYYVGRHIEYISNFGLKNRQSRTHEQCNCSFYSMHDLKTVQNNSQTFIFSKHNFPNNIYIFLGFNLIVLDEFIDVTFTSYSDHHILYQMRRKLCCCSCAHFIFVTSLVKG